jgi:hypothetical protein
LDPQVGLQGTWERIIIDPVAYLKNQNKRKKQIQKYRKIKIRLSKVTNT